MHGNVAWLAVGTVAVLIGFAPARAESPDPESGDSSDSGRFLFRVLDTEGKPVGGVSIYRHMRIGSPMAEAGGWDELGPAVSDNKGHASLAADIVFRNGLPEADDEMSPILAIQPRKKLAALVQVSRRDIGREIQLQMEPACRVTGTVTSSSLSELGRRFERYTVYVTLDSLPYLSKMPVSAYLEESGFEILLPPGRWTVELFDRETTYAALRRIEIKAGQRELNLGRIDLPVQRRLTLIGRPAPELRGIKAWKNGGPLRLSDLKGKLVLLDFWGYWCAPCLARMPKLMELHNQYADHGLVIIAIHDDSVESVAELDSILDESPVRRKRWPDGELPFAVAIDGGGDVRIDGTEKTVRGTTCAAYGIVRWPTVVLIDRAGQVVYAGSHQEEFEERLHGLLSDRPGDATQRLQTSDK